MKPRLQDKFEKEIIGSLAEKLGRRNHLSLPRLDKVVVSMGVGSAISDKKHLEESVSALTEITGQKPIPCKARKSVANFRLRAGSEIGCKVTLRRQRMYEFLDRLVNIAMPRIRDFRGISAKSFDGRGNYALGIKEQIIFPEIEYDKVDKIRGMDVIICTTAKTDEQVADVFTKHFREGHKWNKAVSDINVGRINEPPTPPSNKPN